MVPGSVRGLLLSATASGIDNFTDSDLELLAEIHAALEAGSRRQSEHSAMIAALKPYVHGLLEQGVQIPPGV